MLGRSARDRTSVSGSLSCHVIFSNFLKLFMWKRSSFLAWRSYTVHVSQAYSRVGNTTARYTFSFVASLMPLLSHTDLWKYVYGVGKSNSWLKPCVSVFNLRMRVCPSINLSVLLEKSPFRITHSRSDIEWSELLKRLDQGCATCGRQREDARP